MPSPFGVAVRSATRVCPFRPVETRWLLQPTPAVQLPDLVEVAPFGPVTVRVRLAVPVPDREMELERVNVFPEFVVIVEFRWQVPPEQLRLKLRVAPRPFGVWNERVPDTWPGVRLMFAPCDQPGA